MGRGLSDLQKTILRLAYRNRAATPTATAAVRRDVWYAEVLHEHWGWETADRSSLRSKSPSFDRRTVGEREYRSAYASLSRAVDRLIARGLVHRVLPHIAGGAIGAMLTPKGVEVAAKLVPPEEASQPDTHLVADRPEPKQDAPPAQAGLIELKSLDDFWQYCLGDQDEAPAGGDVIDSYAREVVRGE